MLTVFFGSDRKTVVDKAQAAAEATGVEPIIIEAADFYPGQCIELATATSLFSESLVYFIDTPSSQTDFETECISALPDFAISPHQFYILEGPLLAVAKKKYAKYATQTEEYNATKAERFNTFALADAFCKKDKKTMWVVIQEARLLGVKDEELIGILWWQLKTLRVVHHAHSPEAAGVKSYPYQKAKRALVNFSEADLLRLSSSLLRLYHEGHKGKRDLALGLEHWSLTL
jgi:DNA polymerase III delta subunit